MEKIRVVINGREVFFDKQVTILEAAKSIGIRIPALCHMKLEGTDFENKPASCRVCVVEVEGRRNLVPSCVDKITDNMVIKTNSFRAIHARQANLKLLLSNHPKDCLSCPKNLNCELQDLAEELGIRKNEYEGERMIHNVDEKSAAIVRDPSKCVMCRRCEVMCNEVQTVGVLSAMMRGFEATVTPAFNLALKDSSCVFCGQCAAVCPTGAIVEKDETYKVWAALRNPDKHVVVQVAPAIRVAIGEMFDMEPGSITTGKLVSALKEIGFDSVFDTDFSADLTIMEEASELVHRITNNGRLPMLTSCCPAWVRFIEENFPDMLDVPSTCKSPQMMMGAMVKSYYARERNIDPKDIVMVSIMPCTAKKEEIIREELKNDGLQNVDIVMSTRELGRMIHLFGLDFKNLPESQFDQLMGESTGAAVIFGTTGGVIEAAVRTAYEWITGEELEKVEFEQLRGFEDIRSATVNIGDKKLRIGIAHGLGNSRELLNGVRDGKYDFDVIEIMACPGGCIGGGGQPYHHGDMDILQKRREALYQADREHKLRKSHDNPMIKKIYDDFLGDVYGDKAHKYLHTTYRKREKI
ncbi:MAG: NADH-dependent [FeFe] hydrogenase, group A6 [Erysipelotrichaceae bacterium]|jgi:NADH-quinone oxidoreductase subunit G